jgi:hypothetical protein
MTESIHLLLDHVSAQYMNHFELNLQAQFQKLQPLHEVLQLWAPRTSTGHNVEGDQIVREVKQGGLMQSPLAPQQFSFKHVDQGAQLFWFEEKL